MTSGRCGSPYGAIFSMPTSRSAALVVDATAARACASGCRNPVRRGSSTASPRQQRRVEVGVVEDDVGRLAAELEERPASWWRRPSHDALPDGSRAGEGDHDRPRAKRQILAEQVIRRRDDVDARLAEIGLLCDRADRAAWRSTACPAPASAPPCFRSRAPDRAC